MLMCTILTFAMCADPNVSGAIVLGDVTVPIVWSRQRLGSCLGLGAPSTGDGAGLTRLETEWRSQRIRDDGPGFTGTLVVRIASVRIELSAYSWDHMSAAG